MIRRDLNDPLIFVVLETIGRSVNKLIILICEFFCCHGTNSFIKQFVLCKIILKKLVTVSKL